MSRSPKYTTARLTAQRELELARQRAAREAARRAAAEAAARARLAKRTGEQRNALSSLERRLAALQATALQVNAQARAEKIRRRLHTIRARLKDAADLAAVDAVAGNISALAAQLDRYAEDIAANQAMGRHGAVLLPASGGVLTHCNAGWLAFVDWGTATAPIYAAHERGTFEAVTNARNAAVALGNSGNPDAVPALARALETDAEPIVRSHAAWALGRLGGARAQRVLKRQRARDGDSIVAEEINRALAEIG